MEDNGLHIHARRYFELEAGAGIAALRLPSRLCLAFPYSHSPFIFRHFSFLFPVPSSCSQFLFPVPVPSSCSQFLFPVPVPSSCSQFLFPVPRLPPPFPRLLHPPASAVLDGRQRMGQSRMPLGKEWASRACLSAKDGPVAPVSR